MISLLVTIVFGSTVSFAGAEKADNTISPVGLKVSCGGILDHSLSVMNEAGLLIYKSTAYASGSRCEGAKTQLEIKINNAVSNQTRLEMAMTDEPDADFRNTNQSDSKGNSKEHLPQAEEREYAQQVLTKNVLKIGTCGEAIQIGSVRCKVKINGKEEKMTTIVACSSRFGNDPTACYNNRVNDSTPSPTEAAQSTGAVK